MACKDCQGLGLVRIFHPALVKCVRLGVQKTSYRTRSGERVFSRTDKTGRLNMIDCEIPCRCAAGDAFSVWMRPGGTSEVVPRFGESRYHVRSVAVRGDFHDREIWDQAAIDSIAASEPDPDDNQFNKALSNA